MMRLSLLVSLTLVSLLTVPGFAQVPTEPVHLLVLDVSQEEMGALQIELDLDLGAALPGGGFEVLASTGQREELLRRGIPTRTVTEDLQAFYANRLAASIKPDPNSLSLGAGVVPPFGNGSLAGYYTFNEVAAVLDQLTAQYPALMTSKFSVGTTIQGRTIWGVKISDNPEVDEGEPEVRIDALHHAREPQSMQTLLWFLFFLLENYGTDPLATYLVNEREIFLIPVVNPDGYVYNQNTAPGGGGLWRKNRRNNGDGTFGVDLNRNYPSQWGFDNSGSSPSTSSEVYRGTHPTSEPEIAGMVSFFAGRDFRTALSLHTYSDLWLYPYGYITSAPANQAAYEEIGNLATEVNQYLMGSAGSTLYTANGVTIDHDHLAHGTLSWTPEIGGDDVGFWPPSSQIVPLAEENLLALQRTSLASGAWVRATNITETEIGDGDGNIEAGETVALGVTVRNSGLSSAATPVTATLTLLSGDATVGGTGSYSFGNVASFSSASTGSSPLLLHVDPVVQGGTAISYALTITYEGWDQSFSGSIFVGSPRTYLVDNVETDFGWTAGLPQDTASTGQWERGDPVGTTNGGEPSNPENDATPGSGHIAFVTGNGGGSAGNDDVDNGFTTLLSPVFDLSGTGPAVLSYSRWFANMSNEDDALEVSLSNDDGQSWTPVDTITGNQNQWTTSSFSVGEFLPQTNTMQLRWVASDDPNNSIVEGGVDDLSIEIYDTSPRCLVYGTEELGSPLLFNLVAEEGSSYTWLVSPFQGFLQIPSISGPLLLDLNTLIPLFMGTTPSGGLASLTLTVPNDQALSGLSAYLQVFVLEQNGKHLSNRVQLTIP